MPLSEARRRANNKYNLKNYTVVGCKIPKEEGQAFKEKCKEENTTPNAVFRKAIDEFMNKERKPKRPAPADPKEITWE